MLKHAFRAMSLAAALAIAPSALAGQGFVTVAAAFGGLTGATDLSGGGATDWQLGWVASVNATYWLNPAIGLRAGGSWAQDSLAGATLPGRETFNKFSYDASVVLRYPIPAGAGSVTPYAFGGAGAITLHQLGSESTWTEFAGTFGAGIELRLGRWGFRAEGSDHVYKFDQYGYDKTQHDIAWQGGLTVSF